ncbi:hypothetical protein BJX76DRAFT_353302 [Aspergillus varians]
MEVETPTDYEILTSYALTPAPEADKNPLLFINLADLTIPEETKAIGHLHQAVKGKSGNGSTALIQLWRPPNSALLQPLTHKHKYLIKPYYKDSKANIYGLATLAHRAGYTFFFVADEHLKRGMRGEIDPVNRTKAKTYTGVLVHIKPSVLRDGTNDCDHIRVFARRYALGEEGDHEILELSQRHDFELADTIGNNMVDPYEHFFNWGVELHDPSRGLFMPNRAAATGREEIKVALGKALLESTPLPAELVNQVVDRLYENGEEVFGIQSLFRPTDLSIYLVFPSTKAERRAMQADLQWQVDMYIEDLQKSQAERGLGEEANFLGYAVEEYDQDDGEGGEETDDSVHEGNANDENSEESENSEDDEESSGSDSDLHNHDDEFYAHHIDIPLELDVCLIPWKYDRVASRLDLERYWKLIHGRYRYQCPFNLRMISPLNFLLAPTSPKDAEPALTPQTLQFETVYHGGGGFNFISRNTIERMVRYALAPYCHMHRAVQLRNEMIRDRHLQLPSTPTEILHQPEQPFYLVSRILDIFPDHRDHSVTIPVFFATNSLTDNQVKDIASEVETPSEAEPGGAWTKTCHMVPWMDSDKDAPDVSLGCHIWQIFCELQEEACQLPYFLADKQSGTDLTVVMVVRDLVHWKEESELPAGVCDPDLRGVQYGRIKGCETFRIWHELNFEKKGIVDFIENEDEIHTYPRPNLRTASHI